MIGVIYAAPIVIVCGVAVLLVVWLIAALTGRWKWKKW